MISIFIKQMTCKEPLQMVVEILYMSISEIITYRNHVAPLSFTGSAAYSTYNTTSGGMKCSGNILELQLAESYTVLTINSKKNCSISLEKGMLTIKATGSGSSGVYGNGNAHGPSIELNYDIIVSSE